MFFQSWMTTLLFFLGGWTYAFSQINQDVPNTISIESSKDVLDGSIQKIFEKYIDDDYSTLRWTVVPINKNPDYKIIINPAERKSGVKLPEKNIQLMVWNTTDAAYNEIAAEKSDLDDHPLVAERVVFKFVSKKIIGDSLGIDSLNREKIRKALFEKRIIFISNDEKKPVPKNSAVTYYINDSRTNTKELNNESIIFDYNSQADDKFTFNVDKFCPKELAASQILSTSNIVLDPKYGRLSWKKHRYSIMVASAGIISGALFSWFHVNALNKATEYDRDFHTHYRPDDYANLNKKIDKANLWHTLGVYGGGGLLAAAIVINIAEQPKKCTNK